MKILWQLLTIALLTITEIPAMAADVHLTPHHLTTAQGLPSNYLYTVAQDTRGFIWVGGTGGLSWYDGYRFQTLRNLPIGSDGRTVTPNIVRMEMDCDHNLLWLRSSSYAFFCYDTQSGDFLDYTGCGDQQRTFREVVLGSHGIAWLFQDANGARRVKYDKGKFECTDYTLDNKRLPCQEVRQVTPTADGGAFFSTDNGIVYVNASGKAHTVGTGFKVRRCIAACGQYIFFTSDNKVLIGRKNGEITASINIPAAIGTVNRVTSGSSNGHTVQVFTNRGTLAVDLASQSVQRSTAWPDIKDGYYYGEYGSCHFVISRTGELWVVDGGGHTVARQQLIEVETIQSFQRTFYVMGGAHGQVYITTCGNGLFVFDTTTRKLRHYLASDANAILRTNYLYQPVIDREGNLWLTTQGAGITCLTVLHAANGCYLKPQPEATNQSANTVRGLFPMNDGRILVLTNDRGVFALDLSTNSFEPLPRKTSRINTVITDSKGHKWVGTDGEGIYIDGVQYTKGEGKNAISFNNPYRMIQDCRGRIWIGARNYGLVLVPSAPVPGEKLIYQTFLNSDAAENGITDMHTDKTGRLWVATQSGLFMVDTRQKDITAASFHCFNPSNSPLPGYDILSLCVQDDKVWCSVQGSGVVCCTFNKDHTAMTGCEQYTVMQGLPSNNVNIVCLDRHGNICLGTESGLAVINGKTLGVRTFHFSQQIADNYFVSNTSLIQPGAQLFGTMGGVLVVRDKSRADTLPAALNTTLLFTDIHVNGRSIYDFGPDHSLESARKTLLLGKGIVLNHDQNSINIHFSVMRMADADAISYQFYLEGLEQTWCPMTNHPEAIYSQLKPGNYTLHVKALVDGQWTEDHTLPIRVSPPWWLSWWAYIIYICITAAIGLYIFHLLRHIYRLRRHVREERQRTEIERQLTDYKIRFFTNVSHEFRTPLTIIHGMMERLKLLNQQGNLKQPLDTMQRSTSRMLRLVNQLLEFRKMQQGKLSLQLRESDIIAYVQNIYMDFHEVAEEKDIRYDFRTQVHSLRIPFDASYIDKIVYNLISNAFKYTQRKGEIIVSILLESEDFSSKTANKDVPVSVPTGSVEEMAETNPAPPSLNHSVKIVVSDNGVGVALELREHLFDRYMESSRVVKDSLGIGLTLTAELVRTHHGSINYEPNDGGGSVFTVTLPTDRSAYKDECFMADSVLSEHEEEDVRKGFEQAYREMQSVPLNEDVTVMVVEDDGDVSAYISQILAPYFHVITANDGEEALKLLNCDNTATDNSEETDNCLPAIANCQLVISDVMMPQMDGFELTHRLRKDERWRHIPIILLTALTDQDKYLKGITSGADLYLPKPFSPSILVTHAMQLVNQRQRILQQANQASSQREGDGASIAVSDIRDKNFLRQIDDFINRHISDSQLSIETLTDGLGIGRSKLFEKMKALMDMTPRDYILKRRMEYAVELLKEGQLSIAEIAYKTGFDHPPYFTRVFKKYYGATPSEYIKGKTKEE